jgi:virginiamycin B lyase
VGVRSRATAPRAVAIVALAASLLGSGGRSSGAPRAPLAHGRSRVRVLLAAVVLVVALACAAQASAAQLVWANYQATPTALGIADLNGSSVNNDFITAADPVSVVVEGASIFWNNTAGSAPNMGTETIGTAQLDGSNVNQSLISTPEDSGQLAADSSYLYWGAYYSPYISRAHLDGSNVDANFINTGTNQNDGTAVNGQYIYWSNFLTGNIGRANLDGSSVNLDFITAPPGLSHIAVSSDYIYFSNYFNGTIGRANLNGTGVNQNFITGLGNPQGIVVTGSNIYWANEATNTIERANLDGSNIEPNFISTGYQPIGLALIPGASAPPTVSITTPANGAKYTLNQSLASSFMCTPFTPLTITSCVDQNNKPSGWTVDTSTVGSHTLTVTATDSAGQTGTAAATYTVDYAFSGFLAPLAGPPTVNMGKAGRTYPVQFQLTDANGKLVSLLPAVQSITYASIGCRALSGDPTNTLAAAATGGTSLRYDSTTNDYVYNWQTPGSAGCYRLYLTLNSGQVFPADLQLK